MNRDLVTDVSRRRADYYKNIFTVLDASFTSSQKSRLAIALLLMVVKHAYPKIAARVAKGDTIWNAHPVEILRGHNFSPEWCSESLPRTFKIISKAIVGRLEEKQVSMTSDKDDQSLYELTVTEDNVGLVREVYCALYETLRALLLNGNGRAKRLESEADIRLTSSTLSALHEFAALKLVDLLFEDSSMNIAYKYIPGRF